MVILRATTTKTVERNTLKNTKINQDRILIDVQVVHRKRKKETQERGPEEINGK